MLLHYLKAERTRRLPEGNKIVMKHNVKFQVSFSRIKIMELYRVEIPSFQISAWPVTKIITEVILKIC